MAQDIEESRKLTYPLDPTSYKILKQIGNGVSATVFKAACLPMDSLVVAIKAIDLERLRANLDDVRREAKAMTLLSHPNILKAYCSFTVDQHLWVVMPFMSAGSLHSIISSSFPDGLSEPSIAIVLKETLNALLYLHDQGHLHRDIKAGNILVDSDGSVKLADFGVSASIYEPNSSQCSSFSSSSSLRFNDLAGTPYWMAPEVIHSHVGYSFKADIWSFGITALELAHGRPPLSHLPPWKSLFMRITNRLRLSDFEKIRTGKNKKFSKNFRDMVASCLSTDPYRRPTADKLLKHPFFKNCRSTDFLVKNVLQGLPTVEERYRENLICLRSQSKTDDNDDGDDGQTEAVVKHRRISGWNFNEQVLELEPVFPIDGSGPPTPTKEDNNAKIIQNKAAPSLLVPEFCFRDETRLDVGINENEKVEEVIKEDCGIREKNDLGTEMAEEGRVTSVEEQETGVTNTPVEGVMVDIAPLVPKLRELLESLEFEKHAVSEIIACISGGEHVEMNREEEFQEKISQLNLQLEQERRKSSLLETELESLRCTESHDM
ncbi:hypothetical protein GIB67_036596 [Kingdonia uniflora]|uniref:Protein kinase domain-containing protein n=1 Tax=Kingdonia uniflora TaxID=39325 RepID=A0A7J7MEL4_9MAGN|nr:hypothetical protein GIB67_036596 [Kingdonia uniflora]